MVGGEIRGEGEEGGKVGGGREVYLVRYGMGGKVLGGKVGEGQY